MSHGSDSSLSRPALAEALASAPLRHPERARLNLEHIAERVPQGVLQTLVPLLADLPDPDSALNLLERLTASASTELFRSFDRHRFLVHYALVVFGYSNFLGETLIQNPDLFHSLERESKLDRTHSREEYREAFARYRSRSFESDVALLLARFKRREYVRVMLRDVLGISTLAETTGEISALADVLIEEALRDTEAAFHNRYGTPQHRDADGRLVKVPVTVLSLGKLGGNELNYSSDIDLLFLYGDGEDAATASLSNREYFIRLAQTVTAVLSRVTREGSVFRVDLRLRPQGGEGEPAVGLAHALEYYGRRAADWELQAMLKLRHSAGDMALARRFIRGVQPFIYGATEAKRFNFAAIETALQARDRIGAHRRAAAAKGASIDVKLDRGGIRDIEFLVQCLQRVYGGNEPWLRSGGTMFSLQKLHDKGHLTGHDFQELITAYEFLRRLEHRLQLRHGQQTHKLPQSRPELEVIARSLRTRAGDQAPAKIVEAVRQRMSAVAEIYNRIIHHQQLQEQRDKPEFQLQSTELGREHSERQMLERLAADAPAVHEMVSGNLDPQARRNLFRFLSAAFTSSERYAAVSRVPQALENALELFRMSDFLTDLLIRYPEEIAALRPAGGGPPGAGLLFEPDGEPPRVDVDPVFRYLGLASAPYNEKLALLRQHYRHRVFASGAADVVSGRNVFQSLQETTSAADEAIAAALAIAGSPGGFAVLALGRLGTSEFDLLSDADLLFLRDESVPAIAAGRLAEQLMHTLAAYTRDGTVFPVDARLRPGGGEGELVITPSYLEQYFHYEAQPWEALSYTKLRFVAGSSALADRAMQHVRGLFRRFAADAAFAAAVHEMRGKLEKSEAEPMNLKTGAGGVFDIDFIACYLGVRQGALPCGNLARRLRKLCDHGILGAAECPVLQQSAEFLRTLEHVIRLVTGRARKTLPIAEHARRATEDLMALVLGREFPGGLEAELARTLEATRTVYQRVLGIPPAGVVA